MLMSQDNPKRLILSYQKVDVTYIFHILSKYVIQLHGIVQVTTHTIFTLWTHCDNKFQIKHLRTNVDLLFMAK